MGKRKGAPKNKKTPISGTPSTGADPESYLTLKPVWRFASFDWDGPWGLAACAAAQWREHIEQHLASFETMTWAEILRASGGRREGNNHHPLSRDQFTKKARERLEQQQVYADEFFSLRFNNCCRLYGIREHNCFRVIWFDPYHCQRDGTAAYDWG